LILESENERDDGGTKKDENELVLELFNNKFPKRSWFILWQF
jgi:hypothetical protein